MPPETSKRRRIKQSILLSRSLPPSTQTRESGELREMDRKLYCSLISRSSSHPLFLLDVFGGCWRWRSIKDDVETDWLVVDFLSIPLSLSLEDGAREERERESIVFPRLLLPRWKIEAGSREAPRKAMRRPFASLLSTPSLPLSRSLLRFYYRLHSHAAAAARFSSFLAFSLSLFFLNLGWEKRLCLRK